MVIYKITNKINGKVYIGQTVVPIKKRWSQHTTSKKTHPMYAAFKKYGLDNFLLEEICSALNPSYLNELEQFFISKFKCLHPEGYNLTTGGDSAFSRSDLTKQKQRDAMLGHTVSDATREKISKALMGSVSPRKGVTLSDETKAKISSAQIGKKISEETRAKMSAAQKSRLAKYSTRSPAQIEALRKTHEACRGRIPWNKGRKKAA